MKKLLFLILFISLSFLGHSQYNITQNLGGPTTLVQNPNYGGFRGGLIPYTFSDTTSANSLASLLKLYNGALIYCTADNAVYWRDATNQKWVQLLPSGGTGGLSAWLTTGNFAVPTDVNGYAKFGTFGTNGINVITSGNTVFKIHADGIVPDTGTVQGLGVNSYGELSYFSGGGSTPTWQQTLTAGSTLTGVNAINASGGTFIMSNALVMQYAVSGTGAYINLAQNNGTPDITNNILLRDSIFIEPSLGKFYIDTLTNNVGTKALRYNPTTGLVSYADTTAAGANTALSNLASVAVNTSILPGTDNSIDLGSGSKQWRYGIFGAGGISIGVGAAPSTGRLQIATSGAAGGGITLSNSTAAAYSTMDFYNDGGFNGQFLFTGSTYSNGFFNDNQLAFGNYASGGNIGFIAGGASGYIKFGAGSLLSGSEVMRIIPGAVGIGDATPASLFTVGSGDLFQVNTSGDLVKLKNVTYSWPSSQGSANTALTNDGSGNLSWDTPFWQLSGTTTLTGSVTIDGSGSDYDLKGNRSGINITSRLTTIGDYSVAGNGTRIIIDESNDKLFMISAAISGATTGDALTVVDPSTGEIGVAPNLAFNFMNENTMIYAKNGRLFAEDAAGNKTQISPHNDNGEWVYKSTDKDGVTTEINMIHLAELLEKVTGEKLIYKTKN